MVKVILLVLFIQVSFGLDLNETYDVETEYDDQTFEFESDDPDSTKSPSIAVTSGCNVIDSSLLTVDNEGEFSYDDNDPLGPSGWVHLNDNCDGDNQSPVNLNMRHIQRAKNARHLMMSDFKRKPIAIKVENNGHAAKITFHYDHRHRSKVSGGPLKSNYFINEMTWHWGELDHDGSEHSINNQKHAAEAHITMFSDAYGNFHEAMTQTDGVAALAIFYEV